MSNKTKVFAIEGKIIDKIYNKNGDLIDTRISHNIIVDSFVNLVCALCSGDPAYGGIQYWAVGSGNSSWDTTPVDPVKSESRLTNEIGRVAIDPSKIKFMNGDTISSIPTNTLEISHAFGLEDCNGTWREFGLFGGNATSQLNSGIMINKKHHAILSKTNEITVERIMRFSLSLN